MFSIFFAEHPSTGSGGSEIPVVCCSCRNRISFVKSGKAIFAFGPAAQSSGEDAMSRAGNRVNFVIMTGEITKEKAVTFLLLKDSLTIK